ncbi:hypothetical protein D9619_000257 [Psilocybe cf. subviscida]|uniref:Uncharacterized protein n=1 Tax=Psilocybe cf. subviscida TaxID=2480587 RepID=A0A8H5F3Y1_9AGAR|nr:hypothetical protein D9619_000257 [Psilocybe cf. subviscida]
MIHTYVPQPRLFRVYHIEVKTHKLTVMHSGLDASTTVAQLKSWTLSALTTDVATDSLDVQAMDPPPIDVQTEEDFELCRAVKERGKPTGVYEVVDPSMVLRNSGFTAWEVLYLQFRDRDTGELMPIQYTLPSLLDDDKVPPIISATSISSVSKGKRKAAEDDD